MNYSKRLNDFEMKAKEIFGENFISLSEACAVLGKTLSRKELGLFCSFSMSEDELGKYAKKGFCLMTVPKRMTVGEICLLVPGLFIFGEGREIIALKNKKINPGRYLIKKEPIDLSFNQLMMKEEKIGRKPLKDPELGEVIFAYALCYLLGKRKMLIERICIICQEEIESRMYGKKHVYFQKEPETAFKIGIWINPMLIPNFLQIERV